MRPTRLLLGAALWLLPGVVMAQSTQPEPPPIAQPEPNLPPPPDPRFEVVPQPEVAPELRPAPYQSSYRELGREHIRTRAGAALELGGGVTNFTSSEMRDTTDPGGSWAVRLIGGTRMPVGVEAAYIGSARNVEALGVDGDNRAGLLSTGLEGALRLNVPIERGVTLIEPFAFGGAGWTRYDLYNHRGNTSNVRDEDNVLVVPFGAGIAIGSRGLLFDSRFTYRSAFEDDLVASSTGDGSVSLGSWTLDAHVGYEF